MNKGRGLKRGCEGGYGGVTSHIGKCCGGKYEVGGVSTGREVIVELEGVVGVLWEGETQPVLKRRYVAFARDVHRLQRKVFRGMEGISGV